MILGRKSKVKECREALYGASLLVRDACVELDGAMFAIEHMPLEEAREIWKPVVEVMKTYRHWLHEAANELEKMKEAR